MERDDDLTALPLVDDPTVKDVFAEFCTGLNHAYPVNTQEHQI